ncbi:energy transducer TonB [Vibrio hepatarius]|uniref:energy transducer TonB n=1 Tax=Vibrio hepatarius TaxID=171383 RepID=UPI001C0A296E|nr:energy transducer TonB [Vibrio hepatarius]MBU2897392.1 energy transducer TonB [Vibrio hepatarius]
MVRWLIAVPMAGICTLTVFALMAWMVNISDGQTLGDDAPFRFDMLVVENETETQRRQRSVPEQPKMPKMPKQVPVSSVDTNHTSISDTLKPTLGLDNSIDGLAINAPEFGDFGIQQQAMPIYRVEPRYPPKAVKRQVEGYVLVRFTIDPTGKPVDIQVQKSQPKYMFDREAIYAIKKWKYQPKIVNGKAVSQQGQTVKLEFTLSK